MPSAKQADIASACCLIGFLAVSAGVVLGASRSWDWATVAALARARADLFARSPQLWGVIEWLNGAISQVGSAPAVLAISGVAALWLALRGVAGWALVPLAWLPLTALEVGLKLAVGQPLIGRALHGVRFALPRPEPIDYAALADPLGAFPSGHAMRSAFVFALGATMLWRRGDIPARLAAVICLALGLLFAVSRVYHRWHWPSDVAAGVLLGVAIALPLGARLCALMAAKSEGRR